MRAKTTKWKSVSSTTYITTIENTKNYISSMTEKHEFEKFLTLELIAERYDMCTVDNLKHVLLNFRKHVKLLCCFAMSPAVLLLHDDKDDVAMRARSNLSPVAAPPLVADALQPEDHHDGGRLTA